MPSRTQRAILFLLGLLTGLFGTCEVHAQTRNFDLETFRLAPDRDGLLSIPGTRTPGPFLFNTYLSMAYQARPFVAQNTATGEQTEVLSERVGAELGVQVGLLGHFAFALAMPVHFWQSGNADVLDARGPLSPFAAGDLRWNARARLIGEDATTQRARHEGLGVALLVGGTLPVGNQDRLAGEGLPQLEGQLLFDFRIFEFALAASLGYRHRFSEPNLLGGRFRNQLMYALGIQSPTFLVPQTQLLVEFRGVTDAENPFGLQASTAHEIDVGIRYLGPLDIAISAIGGFGLPDSGIGAPMARAIVMIDWAPRVHDQDNDGFEDARDECPTLPEDLDGFRDTDGCPEPDNDGDLVPDLDDQCPNDMADWQNDANDDGCTDPS